MGGRGVLGLMPGCAGHACERFGWCLARSCGRRCGRRDYALTYYGAVPPLLFFLLLITPPPPLSVAFTPFTFERRVRVPVCVLSSI